MNQLQFNLNNCQSIQTSYNTYEQFLGVGTTYSHLMILILLNYFCVQSTPTYSTIFPKSEEAKLSDLIRKKFEILKTEMQKKVHKTKSLNFEIVLNDYEKISKQIERNNFYKQLSMSLYYTFDLIYKEYVYNLIKLFEFPEDKLVYANFARLG